MSDTVGAGSLGFGRDGRKENGGWEKGAAGLRKGVGGDIKAWMSGKGMVNKGVGKGKENSDQDSVPKIGRLDEAILLKDSPAVPSPLDEERSPQIFANLNIYINGSTYPLIGDHRLKRLLAEHGATVNLSLARRTITHVILGTPNTRLKDEDNHGVGGKIKVRTGAGGGLAGSKIEKEIKRIRGESVKYVGVEW